MPSYQDGIGHYDISLLFRNNLLGKLIGFGNLVQFAVFNKLCDDFVYLSGGVAALAESDTVLLVGKSKRLHNNEIDPKEA